jgi:hypothetical protein
LLEDMIVVGLAVFCMVLIVWRVFEGWVAFGEKIWK